jgi:hypothetical protein
MYNVKTFEYNGFFVSFTGGEAVYTAEFKEWTTDPGIARCICSDGKERLIPSCALVGVMHNDLPVQPKSGVLFGSPSKS